MTDMTQAPAAPAAPAPGGDTTGQPAGDEITVCIEYSPSTGQYSVGLEPPEGADDTDDAAAGGAGGDGGEEANEASYMQPAKDINDALRQAKQLLETPQGAGGQPSPFEQGFANVAGGASAPAGQ